MLQSTRGLKAVCVTDPGLYKKGLGDTAIIDYAKTRDFKIIEPILSKPEPPTIYHCRPLSRSVKHRFVDVLPTDEAKYTAAFKYGIVQVDNMRGVDGVRQSFAPSDTADGMDGTKVSVLTEREMDLFYDVEVMEIGRYIYEASSLAPWHVGCYRLPPSLLEIWTAVLQSADANQSTASPTNAKPSGTGSEGKAGTPQGQPLDESKSANPMDANAEAA